MQQLLLAYFTRPTPYLPQHETFFRFKIGDTVYIDLTPSVRKSLSFKYSLNKGMFSKLNLKIFLFIFST